MPPAGAIRAGRAFVELFADDSRLVRGLRSAERKLKAFGQKVGDLGRKLTRLGAMAAAPLAVSTKVFAGFDDQMRAVQAVVGATDAEFQRLTDTAKRLGRTTSFTAAEVAGTMLELGRAGFAPAEIDAAIGSVLSLARATGTELPRSAGIASDTLRQFGLSAEQTGHVADVLTATANNSAQTLEDLAEAMKYSAPVADEYGLSLEATAKALGALANFGIKGSMAGNTLKNIMLQIADPAIQKRLASLGVSVTDAEGNLRGVADILRDIGKAAATMPNDKRLALFNELFGKRALAGGAKLTVAAFDRLNEAIDKAAGTADRAAKIMDSGIGGALRRLWSAVEGVAIAIGEQLAPMLSAIAERLSAVSAWAARMVEQSGWLVRTLAKFAIAALATGAGLVVLGGAIKFVAFLLGGLAVAARTVGTVLAVVGVVIKALTAVIGFLVTPIGLVIVAVAALGAYILYATGAAAKALGWLAERFETLRQDAVAAYQGIADALAAGDIALAAKILWLTLKLEWERGTHVLLAKWLDFKKGLLDVLGNFVYGGQALWAQLVYGFHAAWIHMIAGLRTAWAKFSSWHQNAVEATGNWVAKRWVEIEGLFDDSIDVEQRKRWIDEMSADEYRKISDEETKAIQDAESKKTDALKSAEKDLNDELSRIGTEDAAERDRINKEHTQKLKESQDEITKARKELKDAVEAARQKRKRMEAGDGPGKLEGPEDIIAKANQALKGMGDVLANAKIGVQGTFVAGNLLGLQAGGVTDRMANGIDKIERNTRPLRDAEEPAFD